MPSLAHELHLLVALMDRRADALLQRSGCELSYARFLVLLHVVRGRRHDPARPLGAAGHQ